MKIRFIQNAIDIIRGKKSVKDIVLHHKNKLLIRKYLKSAEYQIIYPPQGLGDILYICLLLKEYKEINGKKIVMIVRKHYFKQLTQLFAKEVDETLLIGYDLEHLISHIKKNKSVLNIEAELYEKGMKFISFRINLIQILNLPKNTKLKTDTDFEFKTENFGIEHKKGKTIILSPHATSCPKCVPDEFWLSLADFFITKGFDIIFNSNDNTFSQKYKSCLLSISDTIALVNDCGYFIGYRSGLCDVMAYFSNAKKIFIYPTNPHNGDSAEKYFELATTKDLWIYNKAKEYIYSENLLEIIKNLDFSVFLPQNPQRKRAKVYKNARFIIEIL